MTADRIFPIGAVGRMSILFEQILESLFLGFIYSTPYSTTPQRYLTSFAIKRDFFHSFFGSEEDDLDRQSHCENARDDIAKTEDDDEVLGDADETTRNEDTEAGTVGLGRAEAQSPGQRLLTSGSLSDTRKEDEGDEEVLGDADDISRNEDTDAGTVSLDSPEAQSTGQRLLTSGNLSDTKKKDGGELHPSGSRPPMYEFGQQNHDGAVSLAEASRLLFKSRIGRKALFTVLSPIAGNRFRKRQADSLQDRICCMKTQRNVEPLIRWRILAHTCTSVAGPHDLLPARCML